MDDVDKEAAEFFEQEKEKAVNALQEALSIERILKACLKYIDNEFLRMDMPLIEALENQNLSQ